MEIWNKEPVFVFSTRHVFVFIFWIRILFWIEVFSLLFSKFFLRIQFVVNLIITSPGVSPRDDWRFQAVIAQYVLMTVLNDDALTDSFTLRAKLIINQLTGTYKNNVEIRFIS